MTRLPEGLRDTPRFGAPGQSFFRDGWPDPDFMERCGITRVGDLTGLDRVGIPVWFACRPNSRGLSVAQGKGLTHEQARISAVMECIEGAVAEQTTALIAETGSIRELRSRGLGVVPLERMPRCRAVRIDEDQPRAWVRGYGYFSGETVHAPYELVGLDMRIDSAWDHRAFLMSTIGLAAGANVEQAMLHAVCELVENDATTMIDLLGVGAAGARAVDCTDTRHEGLAGALASLAAAGMEARFLDVTGVLPIPVVACFVQTTFLGGRRESVGLSAGFACRPSGAAAALAALLEAVQSRLTRIAGSREDLSEAGYVSGYDRLPAVAGRPVPVDALNMEGGMKESVPEILERVAMTVREHSAADEIHVFPLLVHEAEMAVVRVLIPHLETVADEGVVKLGSHAIKRLLAMRDAR